MPLTDSDGGSSGSTGGADAGVVCTYDFDCSGEADCLDSYCHAWCSNNGDCSSGEYCDTSDSQALCQSNALSACADTSQCGGNQICVQGLCATLSDSISCSPSLDGNDGCSSTLFCAQVPGAPDARCYQFPACGQDGSCPTGQVGAICNDHYFSDKPRFCVPGFCHDASHCPASWNCVRTSPVDVLGRCSDGTPGRPCGTDSDCQSNHCNGSDGGVCS